MNDGITLLTPDRGHMNHQPNLAELLPNKADISAHLYALFPPAFALRYPGAWVEIAFCRPGGKLNEAQNYTAFELKEVAAFAEAKNKAGFNIYVGAALRQGKQPRSGRANEDNFLAAAHAWVDYDGAGDDERIDFILKEHNLTPALVVTTGSVPHPRRHLYFKVTDGADKEKLVATLRTLKALLNSDNVDDAPRVMRLAGTANYPTPDKQDRGYIPELVTFHKNESAPAYQADKLINIAPAGAVVESNVFILYGESQSPGHHDESEITVLLDTVGPGNWHNPMRDATAKMIGHGWSDTAIRLACAKYCAGSIDDPDLTVLIDGGRKKFDQAEAVAATNAMAVQRKPPLIVSSADFLKDFVPPDYLFDGILQRHFIYSMTALTGNGKTAVALMLAVHVALGRPIGERFVERGRVLYLAGENPDDIRMRWLGSAEKLRFDPADIEVNFLPGVFKLSKIGDRIRKEIEAIGPVALVIIDTSAAYFEGDDENGNVEMGNHARLLRTLVTLPGDPCVLVACHPVKNAAADNLLPRGGGAFLNEMDGNLTCAMTETVVKVHTQGKFRGPEFAPLHFKLHTATADTLKDSKGRPIPTVVAMPISEAEQQQVEAVSRGDEDEVLMLMNDGHTRSLTDIATALKWLTKDRKPNKGKVQRAGDRLKGNKLAEMSRRGLVLTPKGKKEAKRIDAINDSASVGTDTAPAPKTDTASRFPGP
jgi:hypothetical protein